MVWSTRRESGGWVDSALFYNSVGRCISGPTDGITYRVFLWLIERSHFLYWGKVEHLPYAGKGKDLIRSSGEEGGFKSNQV